MPSLLHPNSHPLLLHRTVRITLLSTFFQANVSRIIALVLITLYSSAYPTIAPNAGIHRVISAWEGRPLNSTFNLSSWPHNLTTGIQPLPLQSHNDFERPHPLFDALSVGCTAFAADIVPQGDDTDDNEDPLFVAHDRSELDAGRTLQSLYIDPLLTILEHANAGSSDGDMIRGVYDDEPRQSVALFLDLKDAPSPELWEAVNRAVLPLAERGYLTFWTTDSTNGQGDEIKNDTASSHTTHLTSPVTGDGTLHTPSYHASRNGRDAFPTNTKCQSKRYISPHLHGRAASLIPGSSIWPFQHQQ